MICPTRRFAAIAACLLAAPAAAGVILTADVYDTPGLPGYQTFDLTASSADGYLGTFGFFGDGLGITGPLHQGGVGGGIEAVLNDRLFNSLGGLPSDSGWLIDKKAHLSIGAEQSASGLYGAFTPNGSNNRNPRRNLPFARLVTNDPSAVRLTGDFVVDGYWSDGGPAGQSLHRVDTLLSDVTAGLAPVFDSFPERPAPPTPVTPPVVTPPAPDTPVVVPPVVTPPTYTPPSSFPPASQPPLVTPYDGPTISGPDDGLGLQLTANVYETPGLPGHQTFDISVSAFDGYLNAFGFYGEGQGVSGPLHQGGPDDSLVSLLSDQLFSSGSGSMTDSRWLVDDAIALTIGADQSADGMTAAYAIRGDSGMRDTYRTLPLARLVTDDPSAVRLTGEFVVDRVWDDGTDGGDLLYEVDYLLSDILVGDAPTDLTLPTRPAPPVVETPPVEEPPSVDPVVVIEPPTLGPGETGPVPEPIDPVATEDPGEEPPVAEEPGDGAPPSLIDLVRNPWLCDCVGDLGRPHPIQVLPINDFVWEGAIDLTWLQVDPVFVTTGLVLNPAEPVRLEYVSVVDAYDDRAIRSFASDTAIGFGSSLDAFALLSNASDVTVPEPSTSLLASILLMVASGRSTRAPLRPASARSRAVFAA